MPVSLFLAFYAMTLAAVLTLTFGILAAVNRGRWIDHVVRVVFLFFITTPAFWLGILLILLFSLKLHLFPVSGYGQTFADHLRYLFLPALTLALPLRGGADPQPARPDNHRADPRITCARRGPKA